MGSESDDEGSSFFGANASEDDSTGDEDAGQREAVFSAQHAERAARDTSSGSAAPPTSAARKSKAAPPEANSSAAMAPAAKPSGAQGFAFRFPSVSKVKSAPTDRFSQPIAESAQQQQPKAASARLSGAAAQHTSEAKESPAVSAHHDAGHKASAQDAEQWDAMTETDSDDEFGQAGSPDFMSQYAAAMDAELGSSNVGNTFAKAPQPSTSNNGAASDQALLDPIEKSCAQHCGHHAASLVYILAGKLTPC